MVDLDGWPSVGGGAILATVAVCLSRLLYVYLSYRVRSRSLAEHHRTTRARNRAASLVRLAGNGRGQVRLHEHDCDGERVIEFAPAGTRKGERA